jgi:hypothetical protein
MKHAKVTSRLLELPTDDPEVNLRDQEHQRRARSNRAVVKASNTAGFSLTGLCRNLRRTTSGMTATVSSNRFVPCYGHTRSSTVVYIAD